MIDYSVLALLPLFVPLLLAYLLLAYLLIVDIFAPKAEHSVVQVISEVFISGRKASSQLKHLRNESDWYSYGKLIFWLGWLLPIAILAIYGLRLGGGIFDSLIVSRRSLFFSEPLILLVNTVGFVFIIVTFLVQITTQAYTTNLSKEVFRDRYLLWIFVSLVSITFYNLTGLYYKLGDVHQFASYLFSLSSFLHIIALALLTSHFLNISNTIEKTGKRIRRKISQNPVFQFPQIRDDQFTNELSEDTFLITNSAIAAIENNDHAVVKSCIKELEKIGESYLHEFRSPLEDEFIRELNDQFEFLIRSSGEEYSTQKYLGVLTESLGSLARTTYRTTGNTVQTAQWLQSLEQVFKQTQPQLDRTEALGKSIREINTIVLLSLQSDDISQAGGYEAFSRYLENVAEYSIQQGATFPLRICLTEFLWQYISMVNAVVNEERYFESYRMNTPLEQIAEYFAKSKRRTDISHSQLESVLYPAMGSYVALYRYYGIYGLSSQEVTFAAMITATPPEEAELRRRSKYEFEDARLEREFGESCEELIQFQKRMSQMCIGSNHSQSYSAFQDLFYVFSEDLSLRFYENDLAEQVTVEFCEIMWLVINESNRGRPNLSALEAFTDYLLLVVYQYRDADELLSKHFNHIVELYERVQNSNEIESSEWFYRRLKLVGCIVRNQHGLTTTSSLLESKLVRDFKEPEAYHGKAHRPRSVELGYPRRHHSIAKPSGYSIDQRLHQAIQSEFYEDIGQKIERHHARLKRKSRRN